MPEFSFQVYLSESRNFVRIDVQGVITQDSVPTFMTEALEVAQDAGVDRFLLDLREARNTWDPLTTIAYARPEASGIAAKIANVVRVLLVAPEDRSHDLMVQTLQAKRHLVTMSRHEDSAILMLEGSGE